MAKIYCAGPLFNDKEKEDMLEIAQVLENSGFEVFLPQRDGILMADLLNILRKMGVPDEDATSLAQRAIFALDIFEVLDSDALVLNMNGRVPDEGAVVEAGIAWSAGKVVLIYKSDARSLISGNDNPLIVGLSKFSAIGKKSEIPFLFKNALSNKKKGKEIPFFDDNLRETYNKGKTLSSLIRNNGVGIEACNVLLEILGDWHAKAV